MVWLLIIGAHFAVLHWYYLLSIRFSLADSFLFNTFFAFLGISLWYVVRYNKTNSKFFSLFTSHAVSSLLLIGFWLITGYVILKYAISDSTYLSFLDRSFPWRIVSGIFYYAAFILIYYVIIYYNDIQEKIRQEAHLNTLLKEIELSALKNQINPHFLFNSLNSISSLTMSSPQKAQEMIIQLSDYLRYSLSNNDRQIATLETELENIKLYLEIEKIRFGKRLHFIFDGDETTLASQIPVMILQPLFENAIKHGVYESTETITIKLSCQLKNNYLSSTLTNDFDATAKPTKGEGIGLKNTQQRLFLIYKQRDLFTIAKTETTFTVNIKFPQHA